MNSEQFKTYLEISRKTKGKRITEYNANLIKCYTNLNLKRSLVEIINERDADGIPFTNKDTKLIKKVINNNLADYVRYCYECKSKNHKTASFPALFGYSVLLRPTVYASKLVVKIYLFNESEPRFTIFDDYDRTNLF